MRQLPELLAITWLTTCGLTIVAAAWRGIPVLHAFAPPESASGRWVGVAVLGIAIVAALLQLNTDWKLLDGEPIHCACAIVLVYAWACIVRRLLRGSADN